MKRTAEQARSPSLPQGIQQTLYTSATPPHPDKNAPPLAFTEDELRNMPKPPGDYSNINTDSHLEVAIFLQYGEIPETEFAQEQICIFCINNKLTDALSYLCVKHNLHKLKIASYLLNGDFVSFIVKWAKTIQFEIALDIDLSQWNEDHLPLLPLFENSAITELRFDLCFPLPKFQCDFLEAIRNNSTLKKLELFNIHNDAIEKIIEVLPCNSTITHLDLDVGEVQEQTAIRLCILLERSTSLRSLAIKMYQANKYLPLFCKILETNASLESFSVDKADWDEGVARVLVDALEKNQHLRALKIIKGEYENLDATAACILLDALKSNNKLTSLVVESFNIGDEIAEKIGALIRNNKSLQSLRLHCPSLGEASAKEIADALPSNTCLRTLDLYGDFDETGFSRIMNGCNTMPTLSNLHLSAWSNDSFPFRSDDIALLIRSNRTLESIGLGVFSPRAGLVRIAGLGAVLAAVQSNHTLVDFGMLLTRDQKKWTRMTDRFPGEANFALADYCPSCGPDYDEIVSKVRANAEARKLRLGTVAALGMLAPLVPDNVLHAITDELTFRIERQPKRSGTAVMRNLAKMVGAD